MPLHPLIRALVDHEYYRILSRLNKSGDRAPLRRRLKEAIRDDQWMQPHAGEEGTKYYKPFVQTIVPKIENAIVEALRQGTCPEIEVTAEELEATRARLGIGRFGSPQDVLYGFTSERYCNWGITLERMGFRSACMVGEGKMLITMAPRYLVPDEPEMEIQELEGAISRDFWESTEVALAQFDPRQALQDVLDTTTENFDLSQPHTHDLTALNRLLRSGIAEGGFTGATLLKAQTLLPLITSILSERSGVTRLRRYRNLLKNKRLNISQEQIGLKYADEGLFLQKTLGGYRLEHIQSNVKMIKNVLRGNKCEVDSIYRVIGEKALVLVEAKDKPLISRAQVYQIYETFRIKLPATWKPIVIAVMKSKPTLHQEEEGYSTIIDLIKVGYDEACLGKITESLSAITAEIHYRWLIKRNIESVTV